MHQVETYGSSCQNQPVEFARLPVPIGMASKCSSNPTVSSYDDRIGTRSIVGWPGESKCEGEDFVPGSTQETHMAGYP